MIFDYRKKHIWAVAELMEKYGRERNFSKEECNDLYILGLLHDVGYQFLEEKDYIKHNLRGGEILKSEGYKFWKEVYYHGVVNSPYQSEYLDLLNLADMHIDSEGNYVTLDGRLEELSKRYHLPIEKLDSYPMVQELKSKGFN